MGNTNKVISEVEALDYKKVKILTTDGMTYHSDLSELDDVYCFPNKEQWEVISIDPYGLGLI